MDLPRNDFKKRLLAGESLLGLWCVVPDPAVVEAMAGAGYDWVVLDTEHVPVEPSAMLPLLQAAAPYPTHCVVRPVVNDTALIKRHLDMGALTLLIPMVNSPAEAEAAAAAVRYAPAGVRGMAGFTRAARYGRVADYAQRANDEICLLVQVETVEALARLEDIATVEGVDGVFIGPADLAASMGYPGQPGHPAVCAAVEGAIARLKAVGKPAGVLTTNGDFARRCMELGTGFTAVGVDFSLMVAAADALIAQFRR